MRQRTTPSSDWLDPTRVPRPRRGVGGTASPPSVGELRRLLQWGAHAPCTRQGYPVPSTLADSRAYRISHLARRSPSVLRSDGIIGRHSCCPIRERVASRAKQIDLRKRGAKLIEVIRHAFLPEAGAAYSTRPRIELMMRVRNPSG